MVFLCHDINDIFLEACKMARYAEHRCARSPAAWGYWYLSCQQCARVRARPPIVNWRQHHPGIRLLTVMTGVGCPQFSPITQAAGADLHLLWLGRACMADARPSSDDADTQKQCSLSAGSCQCQISRSTFRPCHGNMLPRSWVCTSNRGCVRRRWLPTPLFLVFMLSWFGSRIYYFPVYVIRSVYYEPINVCARAPCI